MLGLISVGLHRKGLSHSLSEKLLTQPLLFGTSYGCEKPLQAARKKEEEKAKVRLDAETAMAEKLASLKRLGIVTDTMTVAEANVLARERKEMTARKRTIMRVLGGLQTFKFGFIELFVVGVLTLFGQGSKGDAVPFG